MKSSIDWKDWIKDTSNKRCYRMYCFCGKDRGYKRPAMRKKLCMSCGQKGKISILKGTKRSDEFKQKISDANYKWRKEKDPKYKPLTELDRKLIHNIRCRLWMAIKDQPASMSKSLGCSTYELHSWIESKWQTGMNWENYGCSPLKPNWEIDHIKPLSAFDLTDKKEYGEACHHTNLQPLWVADNRSKGAEYHD